MRLQTEGMPNPVECIATRATIWLLMVFGAREHAACTERRGLARLQATGDQVQLFLPLRSELAALWVVRFAWPWF